jgi:hypothetical protein
MERLLETDRGPLLLDIGGFGGRWWVIGIRGFDVEGWETKRVSWSPRLSDARYGRGLGRTLVQVLEQDFSLPREAAEQLAETIEEEVVAEWKARGGAEDEEAIRRGGLGCLAVGLLLVLLVVAAIVLPLLWALGVL